MSRWCLFLVLLCSCSSSIGSVPIDAVVANDDKDAQGATPDAAAPRARLMYVSVAQENRIAVVELGVDGSMTTRPELDLPLPGRSGAMAYARASRKLFVGLQPGSIATISVAADGALALDGTTADTGFPVYLSVSADETKLVSAYFGDDIIRVHEISSLPPHPLLTSKQTGEEPHACPIGPGGLVYVPQRSGNVVTWFQLGADGSLAQLGELSAEAGVGPRHISFAPDGKHAYLIHEMGDAVSVHSVDATGALQRVQTISTLPAGLNGDDNFCADVHLSPDGKFLYGSNRGHDSIAMFSVGASGNLSTMGTVPTEARPREFELSPDGRFLVSAGQDSGFLQSYRVEGDGRLTSIARLEVGANLQWVIID